MKEVQIRGVGGCGGEMRKMKEVLLGGVEILELWECVNHNNVERLTELLRKEG